MRRDLVRIALGYLLSVVLLVPYGFEVCPLIRMNTWIELAGTLVAGFAGSLVINAIALRTFLPRASLARRWEFEWAVWILPGLVVGLRDSMVTALAGFSAGALLFSGAKMTMACVALGYFFATLHSLDLEYERVAAGAEV